MMGRMSVRARRLLPSMFLRRLLLIGAAVGAGMLVLLVQAFRLTVPAHGEYLAEAESRLVAERWTPTVRGRILDRKGRVLASDAPAFDVMVDYELITGDWAYSAAAREARRVHREEWGDLGPSDRERLIEAELHAYELRASLLWGRLARVLGVDEAELLERRRSIEAGVEQMADAVWTARLRARRAELNRDRERTVEVTLEDVAQPLREQRMPHAVATGVGERVEFEVRRLAEEFEGVSLSKGARRSYPHESVTVDIDRSTLPPPLRSDGVESVTVEGVATHLLGWMRPVYREDVASRPRVDPETGEVDAGHYRPGDRAGRFGIEESRERELRGLRGRIVQRRDTGEREVIDPVSGRDVTLTLDVYVQARVQAAMEPALGLARVQPWHATAGGPPPVEMGSALAGAAVVLDIDRGEVLAMVSTPTFTREEVSKDASSVFGDELMAPWVNRAIAKPYAPGSPMKPITLASGVAEGVHRLEQPIACDGHLLENRRDVFRCWIYRPWYGMTTHSAQFGRDLLGDDALCVSCNIYFYTLARRLGPAGMVDWLGRFGVGEGWDLGVGFEYPGALGEKADGEPLYLSDAIMMGIGQGPVAWTPLHAADAFATIVRGGQRIAPRLVRDAAVDARYIGLDPASVDVILEGMRRSVGEELGTGHHIRYPTGEKEPIFNVPGVRVYGKTGTAQASPTVGEDESGERVVLRAGEHAWFVVVVGPEVGLPRYAIAVVVEHGGSGGRVAGPIANQVVWALRAEGYL